VMRCRQAFGELGLRCEAGSMTGQEKSLGVASKASEECL